MVLYRQHRRDGLLSAYNHNNRDSWLQRHDVEYLSPRMLFGVLATFEVVFIANTELMIHNSVALVKLGESQWAFSQTLAMLMLVLPLLGLVKQAIEWNSGKKKVVGDEERGLDEKKENHGKTRSNVLIGGDTMKRDDEIEAVCSTCQKRITNSEQGDGNELVTETWCSLH